MNEGLRDWKIPDVVEPVTGYRVFIVDEDTNRLRSTGYDYLWAPGENEAWCMSPPRLVKILRNRKDSDDVEYVEVFSSAHGRIPSPTCECGFWILKTFAYVMDRFSNRYDKVPCEVRGWGRTASAERGYRTEYAEITRILKVPGWSQDNLEAVGEMYGVPVEEDETVTSIQKAEGSALLLDDPVSDLHHAIIRANNTSNMTATAVEIERLHRARTRWARKTQETQAPTADNLFREAMKKLGGKT